ncbi:hypothetical protein [Sandaracinus amylolyticus]|uniref:hypothetical protein n=1 Tax=Sandaracinus amylolyticus TaxID=927083 RepID=UPI0012EDD014|nr:hypothetical protein [Sandaracinus amylolyticus]
MSKSMRASVLCAVALGRAIASCRARAAAGSAEVVPIRASDRSRSRATRLREVDPLARASRRASSMRVRDDPDEAA